MEKLLQKFSEKIVTLMISIVSILLSWVTTFIVVRITVNENYGISLIIATIVPAIVAPLVSYKSIKLYKRIFRAERIANELATLDGLTKLNNRRAFMEYLKIEVDKARKNNSDISILLLDLDHFKKINDNYGHLVGDEVLKKVSQILKSSIRKTDICGRFGGEEFIAVFPGINKFKVSKIAEKVRLNLDSHIVVEDKVIKFSASIGVVSRKISDETMDDLIKTADENLYKVKENGRNNVKIS